ncbi:MAG: (2Fe-2S)-binding protein [Planctomycetes bacterium]|nr:(2Fe-2S)-binding protein [Planctomycetota bacterium]
MLADDHVCLCFHVSKRKIVNFCKREKPVHASLISDCLGAGTGCQWCVPFLKKLHKQCMDGVADPDLPVSPEEYAQRRSKYRKTGVRPGEGEESVPDDLPG